MIPKYTWAFSVFNLTEETPKEITRLQGVSNGFFAIIATGTYFVATSDHALIVAAGAFIANTILGCFYVEKINEIK